MDQGCEPHQEQTHSFSANSVMHESNKIAMYPPVLEALQAATLARDRGFMQQGVLLRPALGFGVFLARSRLCSRHHLELRLPPTDWQRRSVILKSGKSVMNSSGTLQRAARFARHNSQSHRSFRSYKSYKAIQAEVGEAMLPLSAFVPGCRTSCRHRPLTDRWR